MAWSTLIWRWWVEAALCGTVVLALGSLAARACRQPVHRARIVILTLCVLCAILFTLKPPFVVRPLTDNSGTGQAAQNGQGAASRFVDPIWTSKVLPTSMMVCSPPMTSERCPYQRAMESNA